MRFNPSHTRNKKGPAPRGRRPSAGFTMFFAVLVSSLALAIGVAIYDLVVRGLQISSISEQSLYAIYAADTGVECALYWDSRYYLVSGGGISIFPTSTTDVAKNASTPAYCAGVDVVATKQPPLSTNAVSGTATIAFQIAGNVSTSSYALVTVTKTIDAVTHNTDTTIYSHGYNTNATTSQSAVERELQANY